MNDITPDIVRAVNLAYHEEEAEAYDVRHPEIFKDELGHWRRISEEIGRLKAARGRPVRILDVGSGTGFVPMRLAPILDAQDEMILTDLSPAMLTQAGRALQAAKFPARVVSCLSDAEALPQPSGSIDVVTMNSVAHHLPSPEAVFRSVDRLLAPGGLLVIAHEPNLRHFRHPLVGTLDRAIRFLRALKSRRFAAAGPNPFIDRVNARLLAAGTLRRPLSAQRIESIVDIHSPTAGRVVDAGRGFDPRALAAASFPGYAIVRLETYRHLGKVDAAGRPWLRRLERALERRCPDAGALFLLILKKPTA